MDAYLQSGQEPIGQPVPPLLATKVAAFAITAALSTATTAISFLIMARL
jgi:hypothetical protein